MLSTCCSKMSANRSILAPSSRRSSSRSRLEARRSPARARAGRLRIQTTRQQPRYLLESEDRRPGGGSSLSGDQELALRPDPQTVRSSLTFRPSRLPERLPDEELDDAGERGSRWRSGDGGRSPESRSAIDFAANFPNTRRPPAMPRTPLFRYLRRAARLARAAQASSASSAEVVERWRESVRFSRRSFLATAGAATAGLAMGCGKIQQLTGGRGKQGAEVLIIGGGIAGLTCASPLHQKNVPVRVIEGQKRVGGRMFSLTDHFPEKQVCELGGELVDSGHETIRGLCSEFGLALDDFETVDPKLADVWHFDGKRIP